MRTFSERPSMFIAFAMLAGAVLLSPIDLWFHAWLTGGGAGAEAFSQRVFGWLTLLWPLLVLGCIAFSARRLWRAGGSTRRAGLAALAIAFGLALYTAVHMYLDLMDALVRDLIGAVMSGS